MECPPTASDGLLYADGLLAAVETAGGANAMGQLGGAAVRAGAGAHHVQRIMGTATIAASARMAALGIRHGDSSGRIRVSRFQVKFQPGKGFGEGTGGLLRFRTAIAPTFVPILTTLGAQSQTIILAHSVHGHLELELLPHQNFLVQQGFRKKDDIEILTSQRVGASNDQLRILAAQEATFHTDGRFEGLETPGADPFPDGLSLYLQVEIRIRGQNMERPVGVAEGFAPVQGKNGCSALQSEPFRGEAEEFDHLEPSAGVLEPSSP
jgi:hypothetical protein